jgi:ABC-type molybdate transport system substrate-binding protein
MMKKLAALGALAALVVAGAAPIAAADKVELSALVASNAEHAFTQIIKDFEAKHPGVTVKPQWLGGATIAKIIDESSGPADVAMAGSTVLERVKNLTEPATPILQNKEVILTPKGNPAKVTGLKDLANPGVKLSLGTPASAVGTIASQVIQKGAAEWGIDFVQNIRKNTVFQAEKGSDVLGALGKQANATITFASDVDPSKYDTVPIDEKYNVVSTYSITVPKASKNQQAAHDFVAAVTSAQGMATLKKFNYMPPPK